MSSSRDSRKARAPIGVLLAALVNLLLPFAELLGGRLGGLAGIIVLVHVVAMLIFNRRLQARPNPWLERLQVLLFGFVQIRSLT